MSLGVAAYMLLFNRPFYGFLTFDMDKLGIIRRHHWKERLKISKAAKFESDLLKPVSNEDITPPRRLYGEDAHSPTIQTFVNLRSFVELSLCSLKTYHFQTWQFS